MPEDTLIIPPIRQSVEDVTSAQTNGIAQPMTEKSWYLYWDRLGKMANRQNWMVNVGTHADRPPAANMPNGAIYVEFDRGVIYQNWSGAWQYLAGTMYGTFSPDQRPTDLGSHDAGFDFRTTDQPPREFIWSGAAWVEVTSVTVGTHANRPAAATEAEGNLYVEYDRGGVIYQNWVGGWQYLAGTMYGTLVPDQRPTDLGTRDAGFDFRTNGGPAREFIWSGTAWIEIGTDYAVNGTLIGTRPELNLIAGSNVTISGLDNAGSDRVDVTISSSGGGGTGGAVSSVFGRTGAINAQAGDYTVSQVTGAVPNTRNVIAGAGMSGGGPLSADVTLNALVQSVFGRTGAVVAQVGDYTAAQVSNAVDQTQTYPNPVWITSLAWSKITGAPATGVSTVFGRSGAVVAASGDYTAAQVTNAVSTIGTYADPAWITSLSWSKITGAPATGVSSVFGRAGAVTATAGDYTAAQVTNAVSTIGSYADPAWITSLAWSKITGLSLTHANVVTRVGTGGQIVEGGITDLSPANSASLYVSAAGKVGIATPSPFTTLDVYGNAAVRQDAANLATSVGNCQVALTGVTNSAKTLWLGFDTTNNYGMIQAGISGTGWNNLILNPAGGNVGVGTATPGVILSTGTGIAPIKIATYDSGPGANNVYGIGVASNVLTFGANINAATGTPQMFLSNAGYLGIGVNPPLHQLHLSTDDAGKLTTNTWTITSDIRVKQNVRPLEGGLDVINRLNPIVSEYNGKAGTPRDGRVVSLDPAKLREILPYAVSSVRGKLDPGDAEETDILGVNTHEILYHLVLAVQQLSRK